MSVYVANESGVELDEVRVVELARHVLDAMEVHPLVELSLMFVDDKAMEKLHVQYMGEEGPTDVLAFQQDDLSAAAARDDGRDAPEALLGDVVICPQVAAEQARRAGSTFQAEIDLLCTHGVLHLLGYDHNDSAEEREMSAVQTRLLAAWRARGQTVAGAAAGAGGPGPAGPGPAGKGPSGQGADRSGGAGTAPGEALRPTHTRRPGGPGRPR
jgi:probable rRNA maturation factor